MNIFFIHIRNNFSSFPHMPTSHICSENSKYRKYFFPSLFYTLLILKQPFTLLSICPKLHAENRNSNQLDYICGNFLNHVAGLIREMRLIKCGEIQEPKISRPHDSHVTSLNICNWRRRCHFLHVQQIRLKLSADWPTLGWIQSWGQIPKCLPRCQCRRK